MKAAEIFPKSALYWDEEPVKVKYTWYDDEYGFYVAITRYDASDPKQNGFAIVSPDCLTQTPTNLRLLK